MSWTARLSLLSFLFLAVPVLFLPPGSWPYSALIFSSVLVFGLAWLRLDFSPETGSDRNWLPWFAFLVIGVLSVSRFSTLPVYSTGFYRFFWDAAVSAHGMNPFLMTPADALEQIPALSVLASASWTATSYSFQPPVAQAVFSFALNYPLPTASAGLFSYRLEILLTVFYVLSAWLWVLLNRTDGDYGRKGILLLLSPVLLLSGILESSPGLIAVFFLFLAMLWQERNLSFLSGMALAAACGADLSSVLLVPFFLCPTAWHKNGKMLLGWSLTSAAIWIPGILQSGPVHPAEMLTGLYSQVTNGLLPGLWLLGARGLGLTADPLGMAAGLFSVLFLFWIVLIWLSRQRKDPKSRRILAWFALAGLLLILPEVRFWMLLVPFAVAMSAGFTPLSLAAWFLLTLIPDLISEVPGVYLDQSSFRIWEYAILLPLLTTDFLLALKTEPVTNAEESEEEPALPAPAGSGKDETLTGIR
ncbi:MAG: hypothetical protein L6Q77_14830 [Bacteroidetes bacterium]|nr:hypothetical protein [Bacteroidota bacterium]